MIESIEKNREGIENNKSTYEGPFGQNYDKYHTYCIPQRSHYSKDIVRKDVNFMIKQLEKGQPLIDVCCGTGRFSMLCYEKTKERKIYNQDISKVMLDNLKKKINSEDKKRSVFICSEAYEYLKKEKKKFGIVGMVGSLHHLPNYKEVVREMCKRVAEGGFLYIALEPKENRNLPARFLMRLDQITYTLLAGDVHYFKIAVYKALKKMGLSNKVNKYWMGYDFEEKQLSEIHAGTSSQEINRIIKECGMETLVLKGSPAYSYEIFYILANILNLNSSFTLIGFRRRRTVDTPKG